ncbi:hypothetical protein KPC83_00170 [Collinsella sp. zg1085]|uniref:hypothetical protein n=1 Tax=Collinsella sp. zg1085 TaxID=2844380 RepID=UPI001C0D9308|nr:hypothetical protein [Collinsella sp. zg1085]QWT17629.1 hypothetical protein KPC83_00170 [Collinsella sp. zg1085]
MNALLTMLIKRNRMAIIMFVSLLVLRISQFIYLQNHSELSTWDTQYLFVQGIHIAGFVIIPLCAYWYLKVIRFQSSSLVLVAAPSRLAAAMQSLQRAITFGIFISGVLNVSILAILGLPLQETSFIDLFMRCIMQAIFIAALCLFANSLYLLTGVSSFSFLALCLYGIWDFMAQTVVGGGLPSIGWSLTLASSNNVPYLPYQCSVLGLICSAALLTQFFAYQTLDLGIHAVNTQRGL